MAIDRQKSLARFGRAIAELRNSAELSQEQLAHLSGLHRTYVGAVERGERNPTVLTILALAKGLAVPPSELFGRAFR